MINIMSKLISTLTACKGIKQRALNEIHKRRLQRKSERNAKPRVQVRNGYVRIDRSPSEFLAQWRQMYGSKPIDPAERYLASIPRKPRIRVKVPEPEYKQRDEAPKTAIGYMPEDWFIERD